LVALLGWASAALDVGSRLRQLRTNHDRKKTDGFSPGHFIAAGLRNGTHAASIFLQDHSWKSIWKQFQWLIGSPGNLFFDAH
jgi:hypothetical protein